MKIHPILFFFILLCFQMDYNCFLHLFVGIQTHNTSSIDWAHSFTWHQHSIQYWMGTYIRFNSLAFFDAIELFYWHLILFYENSFVKNENEYQILVSIYCYKSISLNNNRKMTNKIQFFMNSINCNFSTTFLRNIFIFENWFVNIIQASAVAVKITQVKSAKK